MGDCVDLNRTVLAHVMLHRAGLLSSLVQDRVSFGEGGREGGREGGGAGGGREGRGAGGGREGGKEGVWEGRGV